MAKTDKPKTIKDLTLNELKVQAYDILATVESLQKQLQMVNMEIANKSKER